MPSPFPGMDPYLEDESLWPAFHHQLVMCLYQILLPGLPGLVYRYRARVVQRHYVTEQEQSGFVVRKEHHEDYIEILQRSDGRLITLVDVVSPANKLTSVGRAAYLATRGEGKNAGANLVEIDLVLQGQPTLEYSRDGLPEWDYAITVTRSTHPRGATRFTPPPCKSRCRASACRWPPKTATQCSICGSPSRILRPGRLRLQNRLCPRPHHASLGRRPPLA